MKLALYNKKRNFNKTSEPKGKVSHKHPSLFVIQKHAASHLHYDLRLELNGVLLSWAVPKGPSLDPSVKRLAMHVEDHPVEYGHFEGIIPKGQYGGGTVMLWDKGSWQSLDDNPNAAYHKGHLKFRLKGIKLKGDWHLIRFKKDDDKSWFLIKSKDKYAKLETQYAITDQEPNSVLSGYDLDEIKVNSQNVWTRNGLKKIAPKKTGRRKSKAKKIKIHMKESRFPTKISPQLATLSDQAPDGNEWLHEIKFDGYRILAFKENKSIQLMSRNNRDWTKHFNNVVKELQKLTIKNVIFDGEIVILDKDNKSNFQLLQNAIGSNHAFKFYIFDLLYYDKYNLKDLPLIERKNILKLILDEFQSDILLYSDHIIGSGNDILKNACEMQLEGIVSKQINSSYEERRTKTWLKEKCIHRQEFVIGGFTPPQGSRNKFGSLYLGYHPDPAQKAMRNNKKKVEGKLIFCGKVGTGFNQQSLKSIYELLQKRMIHENPFTTRPPGVTTAVWVKPELVAEIEFTEWTSGGTLRHPSFKGLREDKPAKKITKEKSMTLSKVKPMKLLPFKLTHPDKLLYPESNISKLDLAKYYDHIQEWILPHIINRPLTIVRCPQNYKECFYQKHINKSTPKALMGVTIKEKDKVEKCIYIKDKEGLMALVQIGTLEIHSWGSRIEKVEYPDLIIFDLDPAPDVDWKQIVNTAKRIQNHLLEFKLQSFVKTTGGKGLHIVIPILPEYNWHQVKNFAHLFVQFMITNYPDEYIGEMSKSKRKGKIFIDYLRNQRGATAISPYSTRARPDAPVAVPLAWDELTNNITDTAFNIFSLPKRLDHLKKDPWEKIYKLKQHLNLDKFTK